MADCIPTISRWALQRISDKLEQIALLSSHSRIFRVPLAKCDLAPFEDRPRSKVNIPQPRA